MMMYFYDLFPAGLFYFILAFGVIGTFITTFIAHIPFLGGFQAPFRLLSIGALCAGLVFHGIDTSEKNWKLKVADLDAKIQVLETRAPLITEKIVTQYVDREKIIKQRGESIVVKVPYYVSVESDAKCTVPAGFVRLLNEAARNSGLPDATTSFDATSPATKDAAGATGKSK